jgi:serpin B
MKVFELYSKMGLAVVAAGVFGTMVIGQDTATAPRKIQEAKTESESTALNQFGLKMISNLSASQPHKNVFVSPLSVFMALAMTEKGTTGATRAAIRQTLAVPSNITEDQLHGSTSAVLKALEAERSDGLSIANALWSDKKLAPDFTEQCRKFYRAEATTLDLSNADASANQINDWVSRNTRSRIRSLVTRGDLGGTSLVLTNAVYFHGLWDKAFSKNATQERTFHLADGGEKKVQMMYQGLSGAYSAGDGFEAVALNYQSSHIRLYAILPQPGTFPEQVLARISLQRLEPASGGHVGLSLPRFRLDFSQALNDTLKSMGMGAAFAPSRDFRPMGAGDLHISSVLHRAVLEVDEEGTTASGTTAVLTRGDLPPPDTKYLIFDRPFAILLCDTQTGAILFTGVVYEPTP